MAGTINIELADNIVLATGQPPEDFVKEATFLLAIKLFELGRISSGLAAEMCDMPRLDFLITAGRMNIAVADLDDSEMDREFSDE
jgi:predicted HTH domain antitoxin